MENIFGYLEHPKIDLMKINYLFLILLLIFSCKNEQKDGTTKNKSKSTPSVTCKNEVSFGDTFICLPKMEGMVETLHHPKISDRINDLKDKTNITLGYYISDDTFAQMEQIESINYDNYFKVYAPIQGMDYRMTVSEMNQITAMMTSGFLDKTLEETNNDLKTMGKTIALSMPTLIEKFSANHNTSTLVILMQIETENLRKILAVSMTSIIIKQRLIFVAYYLDYKNEETIDTLKKRNQLFIDAILEVN